MAIGTRPAIAGARWTSWLIIHDAEDPALLNLARSLGRFADLDLSRRPRAALTRRDGIAVLESADVPELFQRAFTLWAKAPDKPTAPGIRLLSLAPGRDIDFFVGKVLRHEGGVYQLAREQPRTEPWADPYDRRILTMRHVTGGLQPNLDHESVRVERRPLPEGIPLLVEPQRLALTDADVDHLFGDAAAVQQLAGGLVLPPVRRLDDPDVEGSYFAEALLRLRHALRQSCASETFTEGEPAGMSAWRCCDDPLLRDLLIEGGSVELSGEDGRPTSLRIHLRDGEASAAHARCLMLTQPERWARHDWMRHVARAVRDDILALLPRPFSPQIQLAAASASWRMREERSYVQTGTTEGSWELLKELGDRLPAAAKQSSLEMEERITLPSRTRIERLRDQAQHLLPPDNDLAERLFVGHAWRCPWTDASDPGPWRHAAVDLLKHELKGRKRSVAERLSERKEELDLVGSEPNHIVMHSATATSEDVMEWRVLLPLGTAFRRDRRLLLDRRDRSLIDAGLVIG